MKASTSELHWELLPSPNSDTVDSLCAALGVQPWLATLLVQRGIATLEQSKAFFRPSLGSLHDPFLMKDMDKAVQRLQKAIHSGESIRVYGDYDVDGTTSVAMMTDFLLSQDAKADAYVPHRYHEGYGLSEKGVRDAAEKGCTLLITLDCGIRAVEMVALAAELGVDVIVCDHHKPGPELPAAAAVLDPQRPDCNYPFKGLSGCGVGYKLMTAYLQSTHQDLDQLHVYLDLLTVSIAADIVPIVDENRVLAFHGLARINTNPRPGLQRLFGVAKHSARIKTITDLVFTIAPRINAAGRMSSAASAVALLQSGASTETAELIENIEAWNSERRTHDKGVFEGALAQVQNDAFYDDAWSTVVWGEDWHKGVVGIAASRMIDHFYRPTIILTRQDQTYTGSARSVEGVDIHEILKTCGHHLERFGGHAMAAGLSLPVENMRAFRAEFESEVRKVVQPEQRIPRIKVSLDLDLAKLDGRSWNVLKQMGPFGPGNMQPVFRSGPLLDAGGSRIIGADNTHLKVQVCNMDGTGPLMEGVGFGLAKKGKGILNGEPFYLLYTLEENEWNGNRRLQMMIKDVRYDDGVAGMS